MTHRRHALLLALLAAVTPVSAAPRPNFLIVMADDLGFSDIGCYGSEIDTPNIDRLAAEGLRFSQFYNTAKCHSSRISLLTGRYAFQAGNTSLSRAVTAAEVLGAAGYFTAMTGKWHLQQQPTDFGFDRYFGHLSGSTNYYKGDNTFRLNGQLWRPPDKGFYTTVADVDYALRFLREARQTGKPWYLYVAFNAPHAPLQPMEVDYKKYLGRYDVGWDEIRAARVRKQQSLNLFGRAITPCPRPEHIPAWQSLSLARKRFESRRMAAYAGLIDRIDQEMGRLLDDLRRAGELDDTFVLFVSDNGACPYDRRSSPVDAEPYDPDTRWTDSTGWAWVRDTPFRYYKQNQFEGGIATPAIIHWPAGLKVKPGSITDQPAHLIDVLPTMADLAGAPMPVRWPGRELEPVAGISLKSVLSDRTIEHRPPMHLLFATDRGLRDGDWKLVSFRSNPWQLYNVAEDRTELHDLAGQQPERVKRMSALWREMAEHVLKAPRKAYQPVRSKPLPALHPQWTNFALDPSDTRAGYSTTANPPSRTSPIRARRSTKLTVHDDTLVITRTGADSGIAIDRVGDLPSPGPYTLTFRLLSQAGEHGALFFTTDAKTKLPAGTRIPFTAPVNGQWAEMSLKLDTDKHVYGLRLDPGDRPGEVRVQGLALCDSNGHVLRRWPESGDAPSRQRRKRK